MRRCGIVRQTELALFHAGDEKTFAAVISVLESSLRRQIAPYAQWDLDDADDLYSETLERVFERRAEYRGDGPLSAWISRVCVRVGLDHVRGVARARRHEAPCDALVGDFDPEEEEDGERDAVCENARRESLANAIVALPPRMRAMAISRWYCGHKAVRVAAELGVSVLSVWTTLSNAKAILLGRLNGVRKAKGRPPTTGRKSTVGP
ncbi:MAG: RNA polymerase sigma factor [Gemmatimonadaceae bacterium]